MAHSLPTDKQLLKNLQLQLLKNHENNPLPIKKTGKKTPAGMGKETDTAVIINCNKKAKKGKYTLWHVTDSITPIS